MSRGKRPADFAGCPPASGFNSATAVSRGKPNYVTYGKWDGALQFGHGCEPWKTRQTITSPTRSAGFNSATAVSRGKPSQEEECLYVYIPASIRPRL